MQFKNIFFLGFSAGILATVACVVYTKGYYSMLADFSEVMGIVKLISNCMLATMVACIVFFGINFMIKNTAVAEFIFNLLVTMASVATVFVVLKSNDPEFKSEDAMIMVDYYKGFVMPMLFFPALAWFTLKPLFIRK